MNIKYFLLFPIITTACLSFAQDNQLIRDINGDGQVIILSFGDSITFGIGDGGLGDGTAKNGGYPSRIELLVGVPVDNEGVPGEELTSTGYLRFPGLLRQSNADLVLIEEGANDAFKQISVEQYRNTLQKMINTAKILTKEPVLMTLPTPCCDHAQLVAQTGRYSNEIKTLALTNELTAIDLRRAWETTCNNPNECDLYNLPEGLHPTATGYAVMAQTIAAYLLGIDIFSPSGASDLEGALGVPAGTVLVKPDPVAAG